MSKNYSTIYYKKNGRAKTLVIPTIQSLSIPDSTTIPSKPTITGEFRNQYVTRNALKVTFTAWLENGRFGDETLDVSEAIDQLEDIKKNRIKFNLSTSHEAEESRFLSDLVIENISYSRDSDHRGRVVIVVNCVQKKLVNITWELASAVEIFGHDIFTKESDVAKNVNMNFVAGVTDTDFELSNNVISTMFTKLGDISGFTDMPVTRQIRNAIEDKVTLDDESYYYKLGSPIDFSLGTRSYNCVCSFKSRYGLGSDEEDYTVNLGNFTVDVVKNDVSMVENFPVSLFVSSTTARLIRIAIGAAVTLATAGSAASVAFIKNKKPYVQYLYDFADTYTDYQPSKSFEYIEDSESLTEFLTTAANNKKYTSDMAAASTGAIIVKNDYIWSYKINDRYDFTVGYESFKKPLTPDGALKIDVMELTTQNSGFTISISNEDHQGIWDNLFSSNYRIWVVAVTLGAMLQLYLFSPTIFNQNKISASA